MYFLFSNFWDNNSKPKNICYAFLVLSFDAESTPKPPDNGPVAEAGCLTTTCFNSGLQFIKTRPDCPDVASFDCQRRSKLVLNKSEYVLLYQRKMT